MSENIRTDADVISPVPMNVESLGTFADFNEWFISVIEEIKPSYIIGIARGAVRLLQLQNVQDIVGDIPILSDHALPFLHDSEIKSKRILLFDDSVIFGSTLSKVRQYLLKRGAIVFCAAYVIDRFSFFGEQKPGTHNSIGPSAHHEIPIRAKHLLWPNTIRQHHNILIDSILETSRDYNLDFPKFCFEIPEYRAGDIPYLINLLEKTNAFRNIYDVSPPASAANGVYRYTTLLEPRMSGLLAKGNLSYRPYSKARITFIPDNHEIHLTPMPQLTLADGMLFERIKFEGHDLQSLWEKLTPPHQSEDEFYPKAIFRLLTSFAATIMGKSLVRQLITALQPEFPVSRFTLIEEDVKAIVGNTNSSTLKDIWSYLRAVEFIHGLAENESDIIVNLDEYVNEELFDCFKEEWKNHPRLKPHLGELAYEILGKVFLTLRAVTDSPECRAKNPDLSRLEVGLTYEGIRLLLREECGIEISPDEISIALDMCIDNGQAVPKVIQQRGVWLRAFYSGEGEDAHRTLQFKDAIHKGYSEFLNQKGARPLTQFDMHKLCATLKDIFPWLPVSAKPYTFGRFTMVGNNQTELVGWLVNRGSGPLNLVDDSEGRRSLFINKDYESCVDSTWEPNTSRQFFDAFQYVATAFSRIKEDAPKLLLSTCRTHRHTYNAVAVEAHSWVEHDVADFHRLLTSARLTDYGTLKNKEQVLDSIYWCTRYITEAWKKHEIFHRKFENLKQRIAQVFEKQGGGAARFWQYSIIESNMLDPSIDKEIELRFKSLMPLVTQMAGLTAYLTRVLLDLRLIEEEELRHTFENGKTSLDHKDFHWLFKRDPRTIAFSYNDNIKQRKVTGLSIEKTNLRVDVPAKDDRFVMESYRDALVIVQSCFVELSASLSSYCPYYKTQEGDFPFAPENDRRILADGSVETILRDVFILSIEIIKSTDNVQTNQMKDFILETFDKFFQQRGEVYFDKSGNDAFVACCIDPTVLWDIARIITQEGEALKKLGGNFGGTRKGLFFGSVRSVVDREGHRRVTDAVIPNVLPQAFSMLDGVDVHYEKRPDERNFAIIVEKSVANQIASVLNLKFDKKNLFKVRNTKHFFGQCYCFNLLDSTVQ